MSTSTLEALFAENPALRDSPIIRELLAENSRLNVSEASWCSQALEAQAENKRLRDALERIVREGSKNARIIASAALDGTPPKGE